MPGLASVRAQDTPQDSEPTPEVAAELPPGVHAPTPPAEIVTRVKHLKCDRLTNADRIAYREMLTSGLVSDQAVFDKVTKCLIYSLTDPKEFDDLHKITKDIVTDAHRARGTSRDAFVRRCLVLCPELFDNRLAVRCNAMLVLAYLQDERCVPLMAGEIENPDQHPAVKHYAVMGLEIAPRFTQIANRDLTLRALEHLIKNEKQAHGWTLASAARTIGRLRQARVGFVGNRAEIVDCLMLLVTNPEGARHAENQCFSAQAARAIGQLEINAGLDVRFDEISVELGRLASRMGILYLQDTQAAAERDQFPDANWKMHFQDLALAFHGEAGMNGSGLLNMAVGQAEPTVKEFAELITDLYIKVAEGEADQDVLEQVQMIVAKVSTLDPEGDANAENERMSQVTEQ